MGIASSLAAIELTADHVARGHLRGFHVDALLRTAVTKAADAIRDLAMLRSTMAPDDPNQDTIEDLIDRLR